MSEDTEDDVRIAPTNAIWSADVESLQDMAPCQCCCSEHTFSSCPARTWGSCRGQDRVDHEGWYMHYATMHGMSREEFFGER